MVLQARHALLSQLPQTAAEAGARIARRRRKGAANRRYETDRNQRPATGDSRRSATRAAQPEAEMAFDRDPQRHRGAELRRDRRTIEMFDRHRRFAVESVTRVVGEKAGTFAGSGVTGRNERPVNILIFLSHIFLSERTEKCVTEKCVTERCVTR